MMKRIFKMRFKKSFAKGKDAVPTSSAKAGRTVLVMLMVAILLIMGARGGRTDTTRGEEWAEHVRKLRAKGEDVKVMKSKSMTPEKSPREFLKRYKKVREKAGENFTFQTFVEDAARSLVIEQRYHDTRGIFYIKKGNLNPNYQWVGKEVASGQNYLSVNYEKFCITPDLLKDVFGKEDRIVTYQAPETKKSYCYYSMGIYFGVDFISGMNKCCVKTIGFDQHFFSRMEKW
jgi:hypothetical protein